MIKQCTFIPVKKDLCSDIHHIKTIVITYMYLTHLSIITLVCTCLFSHTRGIPKKSGPSAQFRTIFGTLVRIRTKSGIPDLSGPTVHISKV